MVINSPSGPGDVPIEGGEWTESHTSVEASDHAERIVLGGDPSHPVEAMKGLEQLVGQPEVDEHGAKRQEEEVISGQLPSVDDLLGLGYDQSSVECEGRKHTGPDGVDWEDDQSPDKTGVGESEGLHGECEKELIAPVEPVEVEELWHDLWR